MKYASLAVVIAAAATAVACTNAPQAAARDGFSFSFDTGAVAFAYTDGYWDHDHNWHQWRNSREAREYRVRYADHYHAKRHNREHNQGWRDDDHDGVPNRSDSAPGNPHRN